MSFWLDTHSELISARFSKDFILKGIKLILENNNSTFNNVFYNQSKGTAMGTKVAPTYATLVLDFLEEILYEKNRTEKGKEFAKYIEDQWKRYLDDCFMFGQNSREDLDLFENMINSLHKDLKFKIMYSYLF